MSHVLWSCRTTPQSVTKATPYGLTFWAEAVISATIGVSTPQVLNYEEDKNEEELRFNLDLAKERQELSTIREVTYKQKIKGYYDKRVRRT